MQDGRLVSTERRRTQQTWPTIEREILACQVLDFSSAGVPPNSADVIRELWRPSRVIAHALEGDDD